MQKTLERFSALSLGLAGFLALLSTLTTADVITRIYSDMFYEPARGFSEFANVLIAPLVAVVAAVMVLISKPKFVTSRKSALLIGAASLSAVTWVLADYIWSDYNNRLAATGLLETSRFFLVIALLLITINVLTSLVAGASKENLLKMKKPQAAALLILGYGLLNLALFTDSDFSSSFSQFLSGGVTDFDSFIVLAKYLLMPLIALAVAVFAFLPKLKGVFANIEIFLGVVSMLAIAAVVSVAYRQANSTFDSYFWGYLFGAPGEPLTLFSGVKLTLLLAITAFVLSLFTFLERFGVKVSFQKLFQSKFMLSLVAFLKTVLDSSLEKFISRKVSGVLYIITAWLFIAGAVVFEVWAFIEAVRGDMLALAMFLVAPAFALLTLIIVRMAFEAGIALIVIAENTKK
ncbi:MAG: hypothetical protein RIR46_75 [Actinomycetota bacterium]|jgi:hypothetical protein